MTIGAYLSFLQLGLEKNLKKDKTETLGPQRTALLAFHRSDARVFFSSSVRAGTT